MDSPRVLRLTSCQAPNAEFVAREVARYFEERAGIATEFVGGIPWRERERLLDAGEIHAGWICGLPYVRKRAAFELLGAPVMAGKRYSGKPVYFSDIVVRRDNAARSFSDLRGQRWGYNEPGSHSGYNIVRYKLARLGEYREYFRAVRETGAHEMTLRMIEAGEIDASAIDSTVLETEFRLRPALKQLLRIIETWGPSPAPPWVISRKVPPVVRRELQQALTTMHAKPAGRALLKRSRMARFAGVSGRDYDPIRRMAAAAGSTML